MRRRDPSFRAPRVAPGARRARERGAELTCAVLASSETEWIGADLRTGALVRCAARSDGRAGQPMPERLSAWRVTLGAEPLPRDPARTEAITTEGDAQLLGTVSPRQLRRLLRRLAAPEPSPGVVLSHPGPSLAYVDLSPEAPTVAVVALAPDAELTTRADEVAVLALSWSQMTQLVPVLDAGAARAAREAAPRSLRGGSLAAALGYRPGYCLVGLGPVIGGHAQKVVFSLLPG